MTTLSVMAALVPIASGLEEGSELLQSVALVLIGGLLTSTLLTLVFVPAMYTIFDDLQALVVRLVRRGPRQEVERQPRRSARTSPACRWCVARSRRRWLAPWRQARRSPSPGW
jgi:HAE1 family hydrophobic/amphiphilic exporter-1